VAEGLKKTLNQLHEAYPPFTFFRDAGLEA
jgi:hypothetical protein